MIILEHCCYCPLHLFVIVSANQISIGFSVWGKRVGYERNVGSDPERWMYRWMYQASALGEQKGELVIASGRSQQRELVANGSLSHGLTCQACFWNLFCNHFSDSWASLPPPRCAWTVFIYFACAGNNMFYISTIFYHFLRFSVLFYVLESRVILLLLLNL